MQKRKKLIFFFLLFLCAIFICKNTIYAQKAADQKIIKKQKVIYKDNSFPIQLNKIKSVSVSNKKIQLKKKSNNKYTILPKQVGKTTLTIRTKKTIYQYLFVIKKRNTLDTYEMRKYIRKKKVKNVVFETKKRFSQTAEVDEVKDLSVNKDKGVMGVIKQDTLFLFSDNKILCDFSNSLFYNLPSVESIDITGLDFSQNDTATYMFSYLPNLKQIKGLDTLDVSHVLDMNGMFYKCESIQTLNVSGWNTSNVKDMSFMFCQCYHLEKIIGLETWDVSYVLSMNSMFSYGISYTYLSNLTYINISNWNVSHVENMSDMFYGCGKLVFLDVSEWDTRHLKYVDHMFCGCVSIRELDVSCWDVSKIIDFNAMFHNCRSLTTIPVSNWDTRSAIYMCQMFEACVSLKQINVSNFHTDHVKGFGEMFKDCWELEYLDLTSFTTKSVPDGPCIYDKDIYFRCWSGVEAMLKNCKKLKKVYIMEDIWNIENKPNQDFFLGCYTNVFSYCIRL